MRHEVPEAYRPGDADLHRPAHSESYSTRIPIRDLPHKNHQGYLSSIPNTKTGTSRDQCNPDGLRSFKKTKINKYERNMTPSEHSYSITANYINTAEAEECELKCTITNMTEAFKEEMNKSLKDIQDHTIKQVKKIHK